MKIRRLATTIVGLAMALAFAQLAAAEHPVTTLQIGDFRPEIAFDELDGGAVDSWDDLEGRIVVIDFWASWCAPCVEGFDELDELRLAFEGRGVEIFSVTYEPEAHVRQFLERHPLSTRIALDRDFATFASFGAWAIPAAYVFDTEGRVVSALHPEHLTADMIESVLAGEIPDVEQSRGWEDPAGAEEYFRSLRADLVPESIDDEKAGG